MNQTPLKEHLYDNLSVILPQLKEMDDLVHEKKHCLTDRWFTIYT